MFKNQTIVIFYNFNLRFCFVVGSFVYIREDSAGSIAIAPSANNAIVYILSNKNATISADVELECEASSRGEIWVSPWVLLIITVDLYGAFYRNLKRARCTVSLRRSGVLNRRRRRRRRADQLWPAAAAAPAKWRRRRSAASEKHDCQPSLRWLSPMRQWPIIWLSFPPHFIIFIAHAELVSVNGVML